MHQIKEAADQIFDEIVAIRRDIHRHPEIGRKEVRTAGIIRDKLKEYGVDRIETPCPTAVIGIIEGTKAPGKCIALRSDIDALPVQEETGLPFASEIPGTMHACGHDMHASMLLGAAEILCRMRDQFCGTVKLIFQPSEDTLPGGAKELVEQGVMENPHVDAIIGMLLGAARILMETKSELCGNVKLIFQAAEETCHGSEFYVEQGILDDVDAIMEKLSEGIFELAMS